MGWWKTEDGSGVVGDRPADMFAAVLDASLGARFDVDLLGGFLAAFGAAMLRNPQALVADPPPTDAEIVAELEWLTPLVIPIAAGAVTTSLDEAVFDAIESASFQYRESGPERLPRLAELLETIAFVARGRIVDIDGETPLTLLRVWARPRRKDPGPDLDDADWRARMAAIAGVGQQRIARLAPLARRAEIPSQSVGLRDEDRRALLALRDVAAALAEGVALDRPIHPDPEVAERRAQLLTDVAAAIDGSALPGPQSPAYVLSAVLDPDAVRRSGAAPPEWRAWL
jgi:hypothetical protein